MFFSVWTEEVLFITKYITYSCLGVYTKPELSETKQLTSKLLKRKMQHKKKYGLIADPRDLIKNNDRARTFP